MITRMEGEDVYGSTAERNFQWGKFTLLNARLCRLTQSEKILPGKRST